MNKNVTIGLLLTVVALIGVPGTVAWGSYLDSFNAQYGTTNTRLNTCGLCHIDPAGGGARNPYGIDYANNGHSFTAIEGNDADGDGFTNLAEINALTFPGDPKDFPAPTPPTPPAPTASVSFVVTDNSTGSAIQGASIVMDGIKKKTDPTGTATFRGVALGDHKYTVSNRGYKRTTSIVNVTADITVYVKLVSR